MKSDKFLSIIETTPLVSIDLVIRDANYNVLLGKRQNKPAQNYWFVPGGRIRKNETLKEAMARISSAELGFTLDIKDAKLIGAFDHIYEDNFHGMEGINTHYVALGYEVVVENMPKIHLDSQHSNVEWWDEKDLMASDLVHTNTKAYFLK